MWVDRKNWVHDLAISCWDEDEGADDLIGQTTLSLLELMAQGHPDKVRGGGMCVVWNNFMYIRARGRVRECAFEFRR